MTDQFGVIANVHGDSRFRDGARVWIEVGSGLDRPLVRGLAPSGATVNHRVQMRHLSDFRAAWITPNVTAYSFGGRVDAERAASNLSGESK